MNFWRDLRLSFRLLIKKPGFTVVAVLALALGIGPNTAIFSIVYSAFFESLGYPEEDRLMMVWYRLPEVGPEARAGVAPADVPEFMKTGLFDNLCSFTGGQFSYSAEGREPESVQVEPVTPGCISKTFGIPPLIGRDFRPEEGQPGNDRVVILAHRFWKSHFGEDKTLIGKPIRLNGQPYTVIAVMPPDNAFDRIQFMMWTPLTVPPVLAGRHGPGGYNTLGRLKRGVTQDQAQAELTRVAQNIMAAYPPTGVMKSARISVEPLQGNFVPKSIRTVIWLLGGAVCFVLLIACANIASLMLARATSRQKEIAMRASLGASGARIFFQLLVESLAVAALGCVVGAGVGWAMLRVLLTKVPQASLTAEADPRLSLPVLLFTVLIALVAGALFGSVPAWQAARTDLNAVIKEGAGAGGGRRHRWFRRCLVVFEFAAAMTLMAGATISVNVLLKMTRADIGISNPDRVLLFALQGPRARMLKPEDAAAFYREAQSTVEAVPGAQHVTRASFFPMMGYTPQSFELAGKLSAQDAWKAIITQATPAYLATYGAALEKGRGFNEQDRAGAEPVAMVNQEFARRFLAREDPLVQTIVLQETSSAVSAPGAPPAPPKMARVARRIVGVFHDMGRASSSGFAPLPEILVPLEQTQAIAPIFAVRTSGDPLVLSKSIARAVRPLAPDSPLMQLMTVEKLKDQMGSADRAVAIIFGIMAALALLLSAVGIYGVMGFMVTQRTSEIGLRMALGAGRSRIVNMILKEGAALAVAGLAVGSVGAFYAGATLRAVIAGVREPDYWALASAASVLFICAVAACAVPALRASRVDPMKSLRVN